MTSITSRPCWVLAPAVHATAVGEDLVFLHVTADAYFCVPGGAVEVAYDGKAGSFVTENSELSEALAKAGLLQSVPRCGVTDRRQRPLLPTRSAVGDTTPAPRWEDLPEAILSLIDLAMHYVGRPLADVLDGARRPMRSRRRAPKAPMLDVVRRFHRWVSYAPVSGKCLLRSFMLLRLLRRHGHDAMWVFGVTTWPFEAHCWLQVDDLVLDDNFERLWPYQPILVA